MQHWQAQQLHPHLRGRLQDFAVYRLCLCIILLVQQLARMNRVENLQLKADLIVVPTFSTGLRPA